jgi:putative NADH-flavin reductase
MAAPPTRVLIFGATGRTGALVAQLLLAEPASFAVTAFVRSAARARAAPQLAGALTLVEGSTDDAAAVAAAVAGADVVVHALGHAYGETDAAFMTRLVRTVLAAMRASPGGRCSRLIDISGVTCFEPADGTSVLYGAMSVFLRVFKNTVSVDHATKTAAIRAAAAEWPQLSYTIARPPILTDGAPCGYRAVAAADASCSAFVSRADVARFIVDEIKSCKWRNAAPIVGSA